MDKQKDEQFNFDALKLENQLCFPLYACAREVIKRYRPYLDQLGITYTQYLVLMVLWEHASISVKELGSRLYLDSGTLTPVLKSLESKGFIVRARSKRDERVVDVTLTEQGEALKFRAIDVPRSVAKCMTINKEEAAELYRLLYKLLGNFGCEDK